MCMNLILGYFFIREWWHRHRRKSLCTVSKQSSAIEQPYVWAIKPKMPTFFTARHLGGDRYSPLDLCVCTANTTKLFICREILRINK